MKSFFLLLLFLVLPMPAVAVPIVSDISNYRIDIDARFVGTRLFLFGSRNESGDVVVVVRGPMQDYTVRRKERVAGMWVNRKYIRYKGLPDFYAIASSKPLAELQHPKLAELLKIGESHLFEIEKKASRKLKSIEFERALLKHKAQKQLYHTSGELSFMGDTLFKTVFTFPDTITKGNYTAEVYLLKDDQLVGMQVLPIAVRGVGLDSAVSSLAHDHPILYGLLAIALAFGAGWLANRLFKKV